MNKTAYTVFIAFVSAVATLAAVHALSKPYAPIVITIPIPQMTANAAPLADAEENAEKEKEMPRAITLEELAKHDKPDDCWMAIYGKVYDFTTYIPKHPTPPALMHKWCGKDATEGWDTKGYGRPHSQTAEAMLDEYFVGVLEGKE